MSLEKRISKEDSIREKTTELSAFFDKKIKVDHCNKKHSNIKGRPYEEQRNSTMPRPKEARVKDENGRGSR